MTSKNCTNCNTVKPLGEFARNKSKFDGLQTVCRPCSTILHRRYVEANREHVSKVRRENRKNWSPEQVAVHKARAKKWRDENRERLRVQKAERRLGAEEGTRQRLLEDQKGKCAICGLPESDKVRLHMDHCHGTGKVRGLLCNNCNTGIGFMQDSPEILRMAALYLETSK